MIKFTSTRDGITRIVVITGVNNDWEVTFTINGKLQRTEYYDIFTQAEKAAKGYL